MDSLISTIFRPGRLGVEGPEKGTLDLWEECRLPLLGKSVSGNDVLS